MLLNDAGQRVADEPFQVSDHRPIALRDLEQEANPAMAPSPTWRDGRNLREQVILAVRSQLARSKVDDTAGSIQRPRVRVEILSSACVTRIGTREALRRGDRAGTCQAAGDLPSVLLRHRHPSHRNQADHAGT